MWGHTGTRAREAQGVIKTYVLLNAKTSPTLQDASRTDRLLAWNTWANRQGADVISQLRL